MQNVSDLYYHMLYTVVCSSRKIRHTNINVLASMTESVQALVDSLGSNVSSLVKEYIAEMKAVIDIVTPFMTKS